MRPDLEAHERLCVALDVPSADEAAALASSLAGAVGIAKVGLELFIAEGPSAVERVSASGLPVFLDLKLHDIPNTVRGAARSAGGLGVRMLTVHASGGGAMIAAAREGLEQATQGDRPLLLAVTALTSLGPQDLLAVGVEEDPASWVVRLAGLALKSGADGLVCSPLEVASIRAAYGDGPALVVPGVRPEGSDAGDQARVATPREAVAAGADWLVLGRPLRNAASPRAAAEAIAASL